MKTMNSLKVPGLANSYDQIFVRGVLVFAITICALWVFRHQMAQMPDFGFANQTEAAAYDKLTAAQIKDWKVNLATWLLFPAVAGMYGAVVLVGSMFEAKRRVVSSSVSEEDVSVRTESLVVDSMIDGYRHVNYIASMLNIDWCREELMRKGLTVSLEKLRDDHKLAFVVKSVGTEYLKQIGLGDVMVFAGTMRQTGPTEVQLDVEVEVHRQDGSHEVAIQSKIVMPLISLSSNRRARIPKGLIATQRVLSETKGSEVVP